MKRSTLKAVLIVTSVVVMGCSTNGDDDAGGTSDGGTANGSTGSGPATSGDEAGTGGADGSADDDADDTAGDGTTGSGGGGSAVEACEAACEVEAACEGVDEEYLEWCQEDCALYDGEPPACDEAATAFFVCFASLTCEEIDDYWEEVGDPYPCQAEEEAELDACDE